MMQLLRSIVVVLPVLFFAASGFPQDSVSTDHRAPLEDFATKVDGPFVRNITNFVVNNNGDGVDATAGDGICETATGNGVCTLRAAVLEANTLAGDDTIGFAEGISSIDISGQIVITANLTVIGRGAAHITVRNVATPSTTSRVFDITSGDIVTISGLTITGGGVTTGDGGGIRNAGTLTLDGCIITANINTGTANNGGGVRSGAGSTLTVISTVIANNQSASSAGLSFAGATLNISNSTLRDNTATNGNGGGANVAATIGVTISRTTISGNTALNSSGGIFLNRGTIINSTISGNTANGSAANGGGGVRIQAGVNTVNLDLVTITANTAPNAATGARSGIWHETGTLNIANTIVAANVAQDIQRDGTGVIVNLGFNLIGENTSVTTEFPEGLPNGTSYVGTDAMPLDPMLGSLAYNGGFSFTHMPMAGSLAIDKAAVGLTEEDQRNYQRPIDLPGVPNAPTGDGADIGAVEAGSLPSVTISISGRVTTADGLAIVKAIVAVSDGGGNIRYTLTNGFGNYRFEFLNASEPYTVSVTRKGFTFASQTLIPTENISNLDFTADP